MNTNYRFSDTATSDTISAASLEQAVEKYLRNYDTAEMESGETFDAKVFSGDDLMDLCAVVTVTADGKSGVSGHEISAR